jgi:phage baseplate assembly protein W
MAEHVYSDINAFSTSKQTKLFDLDSVKSSITRILGTRRGERFFRPQFGSRLEDILFEPLDDITALDLQHEVNLLLQEEPRLIVNFALTTVKPVPTKNRYDVQIVGSVRGLEGSNFVYTGSLLRG